MAPKVSKSLIDLALNLGRSYMPNEFVGLLRENRGVINEIIFLPETEASETQVFFRKESLPIDVSIVGSVHSHPNGVLTPSKEDKILFSKSGKIHLIVAKPFRKNDFKAFDRNSQEIDIDIVDTDLEDEWLEELKKIEGFKEKLF